MSRQRRADFKALGRRVRREIFEMVSASGRGHVASALSIVEILLVLYRDILRVRPKEPLWPGRDRFILSKGHGCLALYPILAETGFFPASELRRFCRPDGILGGHPERRKVPGVEASTGALGHGLPIGVGMALAAKMDRRSYRVFVLMGDGECDEGSVWEAALCASKHGLDNLVVLVDMNGRQSYGKTEDVLPLKPFAAKWRAFGFRTEQADMSRPEALSRLLRRKSPSGASGAPLAVLCRTVKGGGISFIEKDPRWHHKIGITKEEIEAALAELSSRS